MMFKYLRCTLLKYKIFEHIVLVHECTVNDLADKFGINQKTYYKKMKQWDKMRLIERDESKEKQRNGSHFIIIARPELKTVLRRFREIVMEFIDHATQFGLLFDNKTINYSEDKGKFVTKKQQAKPILSEENLLVAKE
ncbi:MAG: hypothetical protein ACFFB0_16610 [Promethearchaeota archaeon]